MRFASACCSIDSRHLKQFRNMADVAVEPSVSLVYVTQQHLAMKKN